MDKCIAIAACDPDGVLGNKGRIPWDLPEDRAFFARTTLHHTMVMGFQTYLSLPDRCFQDRESYVLTKKHRDQVKRGIALSEFCAEEFLDKTVFVIGGEQIYRFFFRQKLIQKVLLTHLQDRYEGDRHFPLFELASFAQREVLHRTPQYTLISYAY